jgi:hypothetical protein
MLQSQNCCRFDDKIEISNKNHPEILKTRLATLEFCGVVLL